MVDVPVTPKVTDPFSEKTLTATITSISSANPCVHLGMPNSATVKLTGFDAPRLEIASLNSTNVLLFWESPVSGYVTQCSSNLQSGTWVTLTKQPAEVEGTNQVIVNAVNGPAFFRLMKP